MGCTKVAPGCKHCYAEREMDHRHGKVKWGPSGTRVKTSEKYWKEPLKWSRDAGLAGERQRVFCASLADVFEEWGLPIHDHKGQQLFVHADYTISAEQHGRQANLGDIRRELFKLIDNTPNLDWLVLTKRPENIRRMLPGRSKCASWPDCTHPDCIADHYYENVWFGTSVSEQESAEKNIPELLKCRDLSPVLFLSAEPLLGPIDLFHFDRVDWVICGGESGAEFRQMMTADALSLRDQCIKYDRIPFFFKQWSGLRPNDLGDFLDGRQWHEFPKTNLNMEVYR